MSLSERVIDLSAGEEAAPSDHDLHALVRAAAWLAGWSACVVAATLAVQAARRLRSHERRQHDAALLARDAELRVLTAQLEPHFLLNTLTSVLALIDESPLDARTMLERLAEWLKAVFDEMQE